MNRRCGLTFLEVLVLLLLLAVMAGVVVVFVAQQRERAQRFHCANNLRLIGEGVYHFVGVTPPHLANVERPDRRGGPPHGFLPPARIADGYATWAVQLAPYLQADNPLQGWDLHRTYFQQPLDVRDKPLLWYFCPSRARASLLSISGDLPADGGEPHPGAVGDYACAAGDGNPAFPWTTERANGAIILGEVLEKKADLILRWQGRTSLASLKRGSSYTILIGEKHVPLSELGKAEVGDGSVYNGGCPANFSRIGGVGFALARSPLDPFNNNFGSAHPDICQFLMADGSVRSLALSIAEPVLGRMIVLNE